MRQFIVIALLAASANCHAMDVWDMSIGEVMKMVQQRRVEMLEKQLNEQVRQSTLQRRR